MVLGETDLVVERIFLISEDGEVTFLLQFRVPFRLLLGDVEGLFVPGLSIKRQPVHCIVPHS